MTFPQRLVPPAGPGALLKRSKIIHRSTVPGGIVSDAAHLAAIRQLPCIKCGMDPAGEAAHVRMSSGVHNKHNAGGRKPSDKWVLPVDRACHQNDFDSIHKIGEHAFFDALNLDPLLTCERLYAVSPDIVAMRAVVYRVTEERSKRSTT
jgi:hypothetical protein